MLKGKGKLKPSAVILKETNSIKDDNILCIGVCVGRQEIVYNKVSGHGKSKGLREKPPVLKIKMDVWRACYANEGMLIEYMKECQNESAVAAPLRKLLVGAVGHCRYIGSQCHCLLTML